MNDHTDRTDASASMPYDELDAILRRWHAQNADAAAHSRDALMRRLAQEAASIAGSRVAAADPDLPLFGRQVRLPSTQHPAQRLRWAFTTRLRAAASLALVATLIALLVPFAHSPALAHQIMVPDGGRLEALDPMGGGGLIGPCPLKHTDVHAEISGPFTRVTVKQQYRNPYDRTIEAVYTFPLSQRSAVDRMTMTIKVAGEGDRVIEAEMKERQQARQIYESAREAGHVTSLLEQERPNIFTQSVANIEPGAEVEIEISYVELLESKDGEYSFAFPMTVAPRYIPGYATNAAGEVAQPARNLPNELERRNSGLILLGPATFTRIDMQVHGDAAMQNPNGIAITTTPQGPAPEVQQIIDGAVPTLPPDNAYRARPEIRQLLEQGPYINFNANYADGSVEFGQIAGDGLGHVAGRWFYFEPKLLEQIARDQAQREASFSPDTNQVPDASRITPMPVRPPMRAGHDISLSVTIDTGGPAITAVKSDLHEITGGDVLNRLGEPPSKLALALKSESEIPNRDFVLHWRTADDSIQEATFIHAPPPPRAPDGKGGFFTLILAPPARVDEQDATPRELIFVLDTSGSMSGQPIEKAKSVMAKAIDAMRPRDTFNVITFSGDTHILWDRPRPNTEANRAEAQAFLAAREGGGGTEMMTAIEAALKPTKLSEADQPLSPEQLANLPADGREVRVRVAKPNLHVGGEWPHMQSAAGKIAFGSQQTIQWEALRGSWLLRDMGTDSDPAWIIVGRWLTSHGDRVLSIDEMQSATADAVQPLRIVMFLTDGQVGNDMAIIDAVKQHAATTRVFSFGVGDSPNRYLLDGMAKAGRGEVEYVNLQSNADEAVERFARRIATPVLTHIELAFEGEARGLEITDTIPPLNAVPDLFDVKPLIIHGRYSTAGGAGVSPAQGKAGIGETPVPPALSTKASLTIRGHTGAGAYERKIELALPVHDERGEGGAHSAIATLWARAKVEELMNENLAAVQNGAPPQEMRSAIVDLGVNFRIMTQYTSFVAVEKARITIAGRPVLVPVPIEFPSGMEWEGVFGEACGDPNRLAALEQGLVTELRELEANKKVSRGKLAEMEFKAGAIDAAQAALDVEVQESEKNQTIEQTIAVLRERVNPQGVLDLAEGAASLEAIAIQMPPAKDENIDGVQELRRKSTLTKLGLSDSSRGEEIQFPWQAGRPGDAAGIGEARLRLFFNADGSLKDPIIMGSVAAMGDGTNFLDGQDVPFQIHSATGTDVYYAQPHLGQRTPGSDGNWNVGLYGLPADVDGDGQTDKFWYAGQPTLGLTPQDRVSGYLVTPATNWPDARARDGFAPIGVPGQPDLRRQTTLVMEDQFAPFHLVPNDPRVGYLNVNTMPPDLLSQLAALQRADVGDDSGSTGDEHVTSWLRDRSITGMLGDPVDWQQLSLRGTGSIWSAQENVLRQRLAETRFPVTFDQNLLADIIAFTESVTGFTIVVDWESLATIGVTRETPITLQLEDIAADTLLDRLMEMLGDDEHHPKWNVRDGIVTIGVWPSADGFSAKPAPQAATVEDAEAVAAAAARAAKEAAALVAEMKRDARLRRVLDPKLWRAAGLPERPGMPNAEVVGESALANQPLAIIVLVKDTSAATIAALSRAGLRIEDRVDATRLVAGFLDPSQSRVRDLALLEAVRRIEPIGDL